MSAYEFFELPPKDFKSLTGKPFIHTPDDFYWSRQMYDPKQIPSLFGDNLPQLVMFTESYFGENEMVESEEMYWLREVAHQTRVVVSDEDENYYSFPTHYKYPVIPTKWNGQRAPEMTIADMVKSGANFKYLEFAEHTNHEITKNGGIHAYQKIPKLKYIDMYAEDFLVVYSVLTYEMNNVVDHHARKQYRLKDGIYAIPNLIPVCMPVKMVMGLGPSNGDLDLFYWSLRTFMNFTNTLEKCYDEKLKEVSYVMAYDSCPTAGEYEDIHDLYFKRKQAERDSDSDDYEYVDIEQRDECSYIPIKWPVGDHLDTIESITKITEILQMSQADFDKQYKVDFEKLKPPPKIAVVDVQGSGPVLPSRLHSGIGKPALAPPSLNTPLNKRLPPPVPDTKPTEITKSTNESDKDKYPSPVGAIAGKPRRPTPDKIAKVTPQRKTQDQVSTSFAKPVAAAKPTVKSIKPLEANKVFDDKLDPVKTQSNLGMHDEKFLINIKSASDIPHDISMFSISDIGHCLHLLNLDEHVEIFQSELLDGQLVKSLDVKTLIDDFNFKKFDAKKLCMFIFEDWRPT